MVDCTVEVAMLTDVGREREHNEDYVVAFEPPDISILKASGNLYVVADGVGGEAAGEVASEYAAKKIQFDYYQGGGDDVGERLADAIQNANQDLYDYATRNVDIGRMGTTVVAAVIRGSDLVVANVGDSRAYLIRAAQIRQITRDHSLVAKLVEEGNLTPEDAADHPRKNVLLRSLGKDPDVRLDVFEGQVQPGDHIVLCSDGLTSYLQDAEISSVVVDMPVAEAARHLVRMANARGGKDNISVIVLHIVLPLRDARRRSTKAHSISAEPTVDEITTTARRRNQRRRRRVGLQQWLRDRLVFGKTV